MVLIHFKIQLNNTFTFSDERFYFFWTRMLNILNTSIRFDT